MALDLAQYTGCWPELVKQGRGGGGWGWGVQTFFLMCTPHTTDLLHNANVSIAEMTRLTGRPRSKQHTLPEVNVLSMLTS